MFVKTAVGKYVKKEPRKLYAAPSVLPLGYFTENIVMP